MPLIAGRDLREASGMPVTGPKEFFQGILERESLRPDLNRAIRGTVAFMVPLCVALFGGIPVDLVFPCIAAHTIALVDVRGAYSLRLGLLLAMSAVLAIATALGVLGMESLPLAVLGCVLVSLAGGLWRHLSSEHGPGLAIGTGLMFLISLSPHTTRPDAIHPALGALAGGLFGVLLQVLGWPFHPQHPLRRTVAESWLALADLLDALAMEGEGRHEAIVHRQADLRTTLNQTQAVLAEANALPGKLPYHLERLNLAAARLTLRVIVLNTSLEAAMTRGASSSSAPLAAGFAPVLASLSNSARMVALAVVSRQASHLAAFEVRLARLENLLAVLRSQIRSRLGDDAAGGQLDDILRQIEEQLPALREALGATLDRASERGAFSLELFDLHTLTLRPLAASLNLRGRIDPALVRHTARMVVLVAAGVIVFKVLEIPHGYWLPFSMIVVLQPDFGSTRKRAAERMLGTLAGGIIASSVLWLHPPLGVLLAAVAVTIALFSYYVKRSYGIAVIFITLNVVLLLEAHQTVTLAITLERLGCTLAGGSLALIAALIFWPVWERQRFPEIMGKALGANLGYLREVVMRLEDGRPHDEELLQHRRTAESANSEVFSSLRRMTADPRSRRDGLEQAAALANGNQRVTNALSVVTVHLNDQRTRHPELLARFLGICTEGFGALQPGAAGLDAALASLEAFTLPEIDADHRDATRFREPWVYPQLARIVTELAAMLLAAKGRVP
ncbi:FUSC family protein [Luteolibacter flavescens]|uniref:FUSC family protein n=1 Tax=Luteolibacter flavescens TaxID=1859460 RepID=A0ABT3FW31_9BACT|nr:FUSC family protein [Luteolibacter flavescens]MCW1887762.1 FUSC family protein [Luteolibacter flavescens]